MPRQLVVSKRLRTHLSQLAEVYGLRRFGRSTAINDQSDVLAADV